MKKYIIICALIIYPLAVFSYSIYVFFSVKSSAEMLADGSPYCIQVSGNKGYKNVSSIFELFGLYMLGDSRHHAVLVVGDLGEADLFHWSY
ncbi:hypothetical protein, partial [Zooshikella harenae]